MKHIFLSLSFLFVALFFFHPVEAQQYYGTQGDGFMLKLFLPDGSTPLYENKEGGYGYAAFGGDVKEEMEGEVIWVRTNTTSDSIGCDSVVNDLTGKFALVRRGSCEFVLKCLQAQLAGAKAVIVVNHYTGVSDDENTIINMGVGGSVDVQGLHIPCISVCRKVGELMTDAIDNGQPLTARFVFRSLDKATAAYHYATPLGQLDTLKHITAHFSNYSTDTIFDATAHASITEPSGNVVNLSVPVASLAPRQDTLLFFPPYLPPPTVGDFDVIFSNTAFGEPYDTMTRRFRVTEYTWASDNQDLLPGGFLYNYPPWAWPYFQPGALFGLVDVGRLNLFEGYTIGFVLYDADEDNDGIINMPNPNVNEWSQLKPIGWGSYQVTGSEADNDLIATPIRDIVTGQDSVTLKPRHWYFLTQVHTDFGDSSTLAILSATPKQHYFDFPSSPVQIEDAFFPEVSAEATIVQRLASENDVIEPLVTSAKNPLLAPSKFTLFPNPANEIVQLDLHLEAVNKKVAATLLDWRGRAVASEQCFDCQEGTLTFSVQNLPSGTYLMWVRTEEGSTVRKVMICH